MNQAIACCSYVPTLSPSPIAAPNQETPFLYSLVFASDSTGVAAGRSNVATGRGWKTKSLGVACYEQKQGLPLARQFIKG
ncbi:MAG: hypothetical protein R2795_12875 [Saprospiraceae bacterium]